MLNDILNKIKITKIIQGKLDKVYFVVLDALVSMFIHNYAVWFHKTITYFGFD